ncbi:hypothetical protein [Streptomyces lydicamycinicus]|uniref:hypothetical protein n=1 Tax=Streptomyces lydicamycinicus TaxID=1546107 RepID=UPI003C2E0488
MSTPPDEPPPPGRPSRDVPAGPLMPEPPPDEGLPSTEVPPELPPPGEEQTLAT